MISRWLPKPVPGCPTQSGIWQRQTSSLRLIHRSWRDITFHAQQAVEKTLKGFLCWHGRTFRKTHNLIELGQSCAEIDGTLESLLRRAAPLTEYAWKFRYPGEYSEPIRGEATDVLNLAREIYGAILVRLPGAVRP